MPLSGFWVLFSVDYGYLWTAPDADVCRYVPMKMIEISEACLICAQRPMSPSRARVLIIARTYVTVFSISVFYCENACLSWLRKKSLQVHSRNILICWEF